jgi:hypothetical protein
MQFPFIFMGVFFITVVSLSAESEWRDEYLNHSHDKTFSFTGDKLHPKKFTEQKASDFSFKEDLERSSEFWMDKGQSILKDLLGRKENMNHAKNVSLEPRGT